MSIHYYSLEYSGYYFIRDLIASRRNRLNANILLYHKVNDVTNDGLTVSSKTFDSQMRNLSRHYNVISVGELLAKLSNKENFKRRTVAITFDDGYEDNYLNAAPILKKYNLPACFFVTVGYIGTDKRFAWDEKCRADSRVMTWDQVKALTEMGFEIGSHAWSHRNLSQLSKNAVKEELRISRDQLERKLGRKIELFSYPFGKLKDVPDGIEELVAKAGYACCCSAIWQTVSKSTGIYDLPRKPINRVFNSESLFRLEIDGGRRYYRRIKNLFIGKSESPAVT